MRGILTIITGIGFLIMLYLFLSRSNETVKIIGAVGTNSINGIKTLQGR